MLCGKDHTTNYRGCDVYQKKLKEQPKKSSVVQRLQQKSAKLQIATKMFTPTQTYAQITTKDENTKTKVKTEVINNEPTIRNLMLMLNRFQAEVKDSFRQLTVGVEKLERSKQPKASQQKN